MSYRYLDDLIVFLPNQTDANFVFESIEKQSKKLGLVVHPIDDKKSYIKRTNQKFEYLGIDVEKGRLHIPPDQTLKFFNHISLHICNKQKINEYGFLRVRKVLEYFIGGWKNYYRDLVPDGYALIKGEMDLKLMAHYIKVFPEKYRSLYIDDKKLYL